MQFVLDDVAISVVIWPRPLLVDGEPCQAKFDRARNRVMISHEILPADREDKLIHELRHAWTDRYGMPDDAEADAICAEKFYRWYRDQFETQGGRNALSLMQPEAEARPRRGLGANFTEYTRCACEAPVAPGSIVTGLPAWVDAVNGYVARRSMHCENCGRVSEWSELCTAEGYLLNSPVMTPPPRELVGEEKFEWLAKHGDTARVLV